MTVACNGGSLSRRLFVMLAVQMAAGAAVLSLVVYGITMSGLEARQDRLFGEKWLMLQRLVADADAGSDPKAMQARLDHSFRGYLGLSLDLQTARGEVLYRKASELPDPGRSRQMEWAFPARDAQSSATRAVLAMDVSADDALLRDLAVALLLSSIAGVLLIALAGLLLVRLGLAPLRSLVDQTRQLTPETLGRRLECTGQPEELQPLVEQFNELLARLEAAYEQIRAFNADVAHELRTPLATLIVSSELALRGPQGSGTLHDALASNLEELNRMAAIVNDMLFLSRADRGDRARRQHVVSLATLAAEVVAFHEPALDEAALRCEVVGDAHGQFDAPLLRRALSNLLGNATRFARHGSVVRIEIATPPGTPGRVTIAVANEGETVDPAFLPRLFDRFYQAGPTRGSAGLNHGLGLAIVAAIARMHDGRPFATSQRGTTRIGIDSALAC